MIKVHSVSGYIMCMWKVRALLAGELATVKQQMRALCTRVCVWSLRKKDWDIVFATRSAMILKCT